MCGGVRLEEEGSCGAPGTPCVVVSFAEPVREWEEKGGRGREKLYDGVDAVVEVDVPVLGLSVPGYRVGGADWDMEAEEGARSPAEMAEASELSPPSRVNFFPSRNGSFRVASGFDIVFGAEVDEEIRARRGGEEEEERRRRRGRSR